MSQKEPRGSLVKMGKSCPGLNNVVHLCDTLQHLPARSNNESDSVFKCSSSLNRPTLCEFPFIRYVKRSISLVLSFRSYFGCHFVSCAAAAEPLRWKCAQVLTF